MDIKEWLCTLPEILILFPAAALCYFPVKDQMRYTPMKTAALVAAVLVPCVFLGACLCTFFHMDIDFFMFPLLVVLFLFYRCTIKTDLSRSLAVYINVCTLQTFPAQFAYVFDAWLHPGSGAADFSVQAAFFQLGVSCLLMLILAYPACRWSSWMIDDLGSAKVWYSVLALSFVFLILNILCVPRSYSTLYTGRVFFLFLILEAGALAILLFLYTAFYHIAVVILKQAKLEKQVYLLEMQASRYQSLQDHMIQTARLRHDFKHSIHLLAGLADKGDLENLKIYLKEYGQQPAVDSSIHFCANAALNALFNYYHERAVSAAIFTDWHLELPEPLTVSELDMASLFGNLMDNAIAGCRGVPERKRYFSLSTEIRHGNSLYIVSTNSFDGRIRKGKDGYLSTRHTGKGMGLLSIAAVAEKYHGYARVSNSEEEFLVDVVIKV